MSELRPRRTHGTSEYAAGVVSGISGCWDLVRCDYLNLIAAARIAGERSVEQRLDIAVGCALCRGDSSGYQGSRVDDRESLRLNGNRFARSGILSLARRLD